MSPRRPPGRMLGALALLAASPGLTGCLALPWTVPATNPSAGASPGTARAVLQVTSVADGDTFTGKDAAGRKVKVRMLSIDAPELAHDGNSAACGSKPAAARLRALLSGRKVTLVGDPKSDPVDRYGRRLAYVERDGHDIALQLVSEGLVEAWYPSGEPRPARYASYAAAEKAARQSRTGSWASCPTLGR